MAKSSILLSIIKTLDVFRTNKLAIKIKILKKFEKESLVKLSKNIFSVSFELFKIIAIVKRIIAELKLKIKLKLSLIKTPIIKTEKIDKVKIFRILIALILVFILNNFLKLLSLNIGDLEIIFIKSSSF